MPSLQFSVNSYYLLVKVPHVVLYKTLNSREMRGTQDIPIMRRFISYRKESVPLQATSQKQIQKLFPMKFVVLTTVIMRIVVY